MTQSRSKAKGRAQGDADPPADIAAMLTAAASPPRRPRLMPGAEAPAEHVPWTGVVAMGAKDQRPRGTLNVNTRVQVCNVRALSSSGFVANVMQVKECHHAHTFWVADDLEYAKVIQYVQDADAKNLVDEALSTGAILQVKGGVEMVPEKDGYAPYPGVDGESWALVQTKMDTSRTTVLSLAKERCYLTHRLGSLDASRLPVNAMLNVMGRLVGTMAGADGSPGGQVVIRLASDEFLAFTCNNATLFQEVQDHWSSSDGDADNEREWVVIHHLKLKRPAATADMPATFTFRQEQGAFLGYVITSPDVLSWFEWMDAEKGDLIARHM